MTGKRISRRRFLQGVSALGATAALGSQISTSSEAQPHVNQTDLHTFIPRILRSYQSDRWNIITVMFDTWRYDHVGYHGNGWIQTPNLDAFAAQSLVFDRAYAGGFPTVLNRAELLTGRPMYPWMGWEDMPAGETVLAQVLNAAGYSTGLVFDTPHFKDNGFSLDRAFQSWEWVRGQEADRYRANPPHPPLPADPSKLRHGAEVVEQYLRNQGERTSEADYMVARTVSAGIEWLRRNYDQNVFYLHIDSFDPHEPWDPPQTYVDLYNPGYSGEQLIYPLYAPADYVTASQLAHVRALYAAEVTLADHWLGVLLDELETLGLAENTIVIVMSDHGILLGEHDSIGKAWDHQGHYECYPLYEELTHIPLMIRVPGKTARRTDALVQPIDLMPTILELAGADTPGTIQGVSLVPLIEGDGTVVPPLRTVAVSARSLKTSLDAKPRITVSDGEWTLIHGAAHASSELYYLPNDPQQQNNLIDSQCSIASALHTQLIALFESMEVDETLLAAWRSGPC